MTERFGFTIERLPSATYRVTWVTQETRSSPAKEHEIFFASKASIVAMANNYRASDELRAFIRGELISGMVVK